MSKKETQNTEQKQEKVMTKYDLKMQKRAEAKKQEQREKTKSTVMGILFVVVLALVVISFPIRSYFTVNGSYIEVNGEKISRVEYDYNYSIAKTGFLSSYGNYLYYMGLDISTNFDDEMYTEMRTWGDYFDELTVDNITQNKALLAEAKAAGFEYDVTQEYKEYEEALEASAKEQGLTVKAFIQEMYGPYATASRVKPFIEEALYTAAYYEEVADSNLPTEDEVKAYYAANTAEYDSVDYYVFSVDANLPTEPTNADAAETTTDATAAPDATSTTDTTAYEPTEEEIAAAMAEAKATAEAALANIRRDGEFTINVTKADAVYILRDWLFSDERKEGDTTVIEDSMNSRYYAVEFASRYLNESLSADVRVVMTADGNAQEIYDEWKNGAATEESFAEICDKYNDATVTSAKGGFYEGLRSASLGEELRSWIFSSDRVAGETAVITPEDDEYSYVVYYVAPNKAEYILSIESTIVEEIMAEYMEEIMAKIEISDPKDNLKYPELIEAEEAAAAEAAASSAASDTQSTESSTAQ